MDRIKLLQTNLDASDRRLAAYTRQYQNDLEVASARLRHFNPTNNPDMFTDPSDRVISFTTEGKKHYSQLNNDLDQLRQTYHERSDIEQAYQKNVVVQLVAELNKQSSCNVHSLVDRILDVAADSCPDQWVAGPRTLDEWAAN